MTETMPEIWPGPMEGIAQSAFLNTVVKLHLADRWMTHFLRISAAVPPLRRFREFLAPYLTGNLPVTLQLMGSSPEMLGECSRLASALPLAGINLNAGCPSRRVTGHHSGGGLLRNLPQLREILLRMRDNCGALPLSVKLRCAWDNPEELPAVAACLQDCGLSKVFFHYRTVSEGYLPVPGRLERFQAAVKLFFPLPVILNGDVASSDELPELLKLGCSGVMCARAWLHDPWLLRRLSARENENLPSPAAGRQIFFAELRRSGISGGNAVELAKLIFGSASSEFRNFLREEGRLPEY